MLPSPGHLRLGSAASAISATPGRKKFALDYGYEVSEYWSELAAKGMSADQYITFFADSGKEFTYS